MRSLLCVLLVFSRLALAQAIEEKARLMGCMTSRLSIPGLMDLSGRSKLVKFSEQSIRQAAEECSGPNSNLELTSEQSRVLFGEGLDRPDLDAYSRARLVCLNDLMSNFIKITFKVREGRSLSKTQYERALQEIEKVCNSGSLKLMSLRIAMRNPKDTVLLMFLEMEWMLENQEKQVNEFY